DLVARQHQESPRTRRAGRRPPPPHVGPPPTKKNPDPPPPPSARPPLPHPSIVTLRTIAPLGTWVSGLRHDAATAPDALELLRLLHPTAAVGGIPRNDAYELIVRLEQHDRGHYAGPLGWIDANGDGEWWIGIRGVIISGTAFEAWAGAGIVSESDPIAEREETKEKLAAVLSSVLVDR